MKKVGYIVSLIILILGFILMNYTSFEGFVVENIDNTELVLVERVIDGDTVVVNGTSVRMLGLNTPEKGEKYYTEAKEYTSNFVLNKTIKIERRGKDRYDRELAYLFDVDTGKNINAEIVREGYANYYFPDVHDNYYNLFVEAWEECISSNKNLCEKSLDKCSDCIVLHKFGPDEELVLYNQCEFDCDFEGWSVKDEGRKTYVFEDFVLKENYQVTLTAEDFNQTYVWTNTGDTMFLRDEDGGLVLWENY
jgi:micrococcal nuclease